MRPVGIIANPQSGKDLRRLTSAAGQVSDGVKVDIVRQLVLGALEAGVERVLLTADRGNLGARASVEFDSRVELLDGPATGSRLDSVDGAEQLAKHDAVVIGLGGDGTSRDLATGWPGLPLIALSTGTNNVFPKVLNPTAAGLAAGHIATGNVALDDVAVESKRIVVVDGVRERCALVDVALIGTNAVGARAVTDPSTVRWVLAAIAEPATTGLSTIAAQVGRRSRTDPGALLVRLGPGGRTVRAATSPGEFHTLEVTEVIEVEEGEEVALNGIGVLAFDGEREVPLSPGSVAIVDRLGPLLIDVDATLRAAVAKGH